MQQLWKWAKDLQQGIHLEKDAIGQEEDRLLIFSRISLEFISYLGELSYWNFLRFFVIAQTLKSCMSRWASKK